MKNIAAEPVAMTFMEHWIAVFGISCTITTDRGTQLESELFTKLANVLGMNRVRTRAYFPQAWTEVLPLVLLDIRASV